MARAQYDIHDLDHLGVPARQVTVTCRHGEVTRVFVRQRGHRLPPDQTLVQVTAAEHLATCGCTCAGTFVQPRAPCRRGRGA